MSTKNDQLAINGGLPVIKGALKNRFNIGTEERDAVLAMFDRAIESGQAPGYNGPEEEQLCRDFANFMGGGYADAVNSGTTAVFVALRALELEPFSEVIVSPVTDPGGMMPILMNNCIPVVADSAPGSYNTNAKMIEARITEYTRAIIVSHIMGEAAEMPAIMKLARKYNLKVLEDCAQSHGCELNGQYVGTFGDVAAFSTMFGKHFNTGGQGGMVFTKSEETYWKIRQQADRGKPFGLEAGSTNCVASLNFNLSDMCAAIGVEQLKKLKGLVERRRNLVGLLKEKFSKLKAIKVPVLPEGSNPSYWYFRLGFNESAVTCSKSEFLNAVEAEGVQLIKDYTFARPYLMDWFVNKKAFGTGGFPWTAPQYKGKYTNGFECPNVDKALNECFNLFVYESWGEEEAELIFKAFEKVEKAYS
ncbi:MAG TPA: DegT/DnrJ/EryC1/StrS family aminotransferase [Clostridia bacterium]|nr:DegT/DnrJ/EryC1/StrS family aminotransferase [Clostridia bacterium]HPQ46643.1 DegT/DnrJ/EryC1/StrS family aminotransferase [Clostridia bacterium]HRX42722.1 DegT/DnrJ/EryC1/StrS family aminotransferase [Clostridia bacterium]